MGGMETAVQLTTTVRELPEAEWPRVLEFEPFATHGIPVGEHWRIIVAEQDGHVVGFCCLFDAVHFEPWYIRPDQRGNPAVVRGLLRESRQMLTEAGIKGVFAVVERSASGLVPLSYEHMLSRLGFRPAQGQLYFLATDDLPEGY